MSVGRKGTRISLNTLSNSKPHELTIECCIFFYGHLLRVLEFTLPPRQKSCMKPSHDPPEAHSYLVTAVGIWGNLGCVHNAELKGSLGKDTPIIPGEETRPHGSVERIQSKHKYLTNKQTNNFAVRSHTHARTHTHAHTHTHTTHTQQALGLPR